MNFINRITNLFNRSPTVVRYELVTARGNGFYSWGGNLYQSDIIRSCIRPFYRAIGKLSATHVRGTGPEMKVFPDAYMRMLLEEPNPYMSGQVLQEKLAAQFALNNNAFAYVNRDGNGYAMEIYPIPAVGVEAIYDAHGLLFLRFTMLNGKTVTFDYADVIHIRQDYYNNDVFGESNNEVLTQLMEIVTTTDQGIVKAIKNSSVIKWLLKFKSALRPEDIQKQTKQFVDNFLKIDTESEESSTAGAAGTDTKADVEQVKPTDFVPASSQMEKTVERIYNFFGTNEKIIQSKFNEDEWNAYYESVIEPFAKQYSGELTRKLFSRRERSMGNKIVCAGNSLQYASMLTKLNLFQMVDRGALKPNEWREVMNMGPIEGGDEPIRRLDTAKVGEEVVKGA